MTESYFFAENSMGKARAKTSFDKILQRVIIALAVVLCIELVWFFGATPCMAFSRIDVVSIPGLDRSMVLRSAGIHEASSYMTVDVDQVEKALSTFPQVESAQVTKRFPDALSIVLKERSAVALTLVHQAGKLLPAYIDKEGVVFAVGNNNADQEGKTLPLLSGLAFEGKVLGARLPQGLVGLLEDLSRIERTSPALLDAISEIRIQARSYDGFDCILYPIHHPIPVKMGSQLNEESLRYMMLILDVLTSKGIEADEIDFRTGTVSYRTKEASSG